MRSSDKFPEGFYTLVLLPNLYFSTVLFRNLDHIIHAQGCFFLCSGIVCVIYVIERRCRSQLIAIIHHLVIKYHILNPKELLRFTITREIAAAYYKEIGLKFFGKKWHDKTVIISI